MKVYPGHRKASSEAVNDPKGARDFLSSSRGSPGSAGRYSIHAIHSPLLCLFPLEEILKTHIAHWWSPDGTRLAYATINDSRVPVMELPTYTGSTYPTVKSYHYPKVGGKQQQDSSALFISSPAQPTPSVEL